MEGLLRKSELRVVAIDSDAKKVDTIGRRLDERGMFDDHRLSVYKGNPGTFGLPPYMASLITSETVSPLPSGALIVPGRMLLQGPGRLGAFDIYTGRLLWETELPEVYGFACPAAI